MAEAVEGAYEVNPQGRVWAHCGGRSERAEGSAGIRERESTSSGFAWLRMAPRKAAPESTPAPRTARPAPSVELTEWTAAPEAAVAAASAPAPEGDGEENHARGLGTAPGTSRGRKLKVFAVASLFLVAVALGARAGLAPKSKSGNNQADRQAKAVTLEDCLAMEREGPSDEPIRRDLRQGREAGRSAEAPSRRRMLDCEELIASNMEGSSGDGKSSKKEKSSKRGKSTKTTKSTKTKTKTSKTSKSSTGSDAGGGSGASPASTSMSADEDETYVSLAPPASEPTTSDPPTSYAPTSYVSYAPTSYPPTSELDPDGPCSGRGTLDPSGRQCTCQKGYFPTLIASGPDCFKVVPVGLGCDGQREPDCREMKFRPEPMCCPRPPRGDQLICVPTEGPDAGQC